MTRRPLGFTLIEAVVVVGIIGIFSTLAITSFSGLPTRARLSNDFLDLVSTVRYCRARAMASGFDVYMMVNTQYHQIAVIEDSDANFTSTTLTDYPWNATQGVQRAHANSRGDRLIRRIDFTTQQLPDGTVKPTVGFGDPANGYYGGFPSTVVYPAPFSSIPVQPACTFCGLSPSPANVGAILFRPEGSVDLVGEAPGAAGGALVLQTYLGDVRDKTSRRALLIARPTGISRTFYP